jgi:hypothetical protein
MKGGVALLALTIEFSSDRALAATPSEPCPISYSKLAMPYKHEHGMSTPVVELTFTNDTPKKIVRAKFGLIITGPQGEHVPYDQTLTFSEGADPGKLTAGHWNLDMGKVDMHRMGETIYLESVRFDDDTTWQDDGNQRCKQEEYYGPK